MYGPTEIRPLWKSIFIHKFLYRGFYVLSVQIIIIMEISLKTHRLSLRVSFPLTIVVIRTIFNAYRGLMGVTHIFPF